MTFQESDFPELLKRIEQIIESTADATVAVELIQEILRTYKQVPLYPGIVKLVSFGMVEDIKAEEIKKGDLVTLNQDSKHVTGRVTANNNGELTLTAVTESEKKTEKTVNTANFETCQKIKPDALKREWPELYFGEEAQ
ncbi:MAG: hypothetical protein ACLFN5_04180 [bacterium]